MYASLKYLVIFVFSLFLITGCHTVPESADEQLLLKDQADQTLQSARQRLPEVDAYLASSIAYAVFPDVGKGGFIVAGGYGKGVLYEKGVMSGYCDATQLSIGAQIGGQSCTELIFFETPYAVERFKSGDLALDAQVSAIAMDQKATKYARYQDGVAVLFVDAKGLMAEASAGGQKFRFVPASQAQ